ncbi:MAG: hypothetical protein WCO12_02120 [bacterium]
MKKITLLLCAIALSFALSACDQPQRSSDSDQVQQRAQEQILKEITAQVGMPAIKNAREKKILKLIYELRDQEGYVTYTYMENLQPAVVKGVTSLGGKLTYFGQTIGYPIPYATQYTSPQKVECAGTHDSRPGYAWLTTPQADPNGLFSPAAADATWVLMKDPNSKNVVPVYSEPKLVSMPFKLPVD